MNLNSIGNQLLFTTVQITGQTDKGFTSGTGFIFARRVPDEDVVEPFLMTAYHVVQPIQSGQIIFTMEQDGQPDLEKTFTATFDATFFANSKIDNLDIAAVNIAPFLNSFNDRPEKIFFRTIDSGMIPEQKIVDELQAIETLTFIGYPAGLKDTKHNLPITRQGITSTPIWNDYEDEPKFFIDGGVYPGSSGSPVFILNQGSYGTSDGITIGNRLYFVGVITDTNVKGDTYLQLGIAVKSSAILDALNLKFPSNA